MGRNVSLADLPPHIQQQVAGKIVAEETKKHKYGARRTEVDGIQFDSAAEAKRYGELKLLERAGNIRNLRLQTRFPLLVNGVQIGTYVDDFDYEEWPNWRLKVEDVKGVKTPIYRRNKKHLLAQYGIEITEIG